MHTGVNKAVVQFVTILSPYQKRPSSYEAMDTEVVSFLLTKEGMKYKMWSTRRMVSGTEVLRPENPAPRGAVMPERRARPWADDPAFAGPRSPAPRAEGGASDTRACRAHKLLWLCLVVSTQHPTLALGGCQSFFSLSRLPRWSLRSGRAGPGGSRSCC